MLLRGRTQGSLFPPNLHVFILFHKEYSGWETPLDTYGKAHAMEEGLELGFNKVLLRADLKKNIHFL